MPITSVCRTCDRSYDKNKASADYTGYCTQRCLHEMSRRHGYRPHLRHPTRSEYEVLRDAGLIGDVPIVKPPVAIDGRSPKLLALKEKETEHRKVYRVVVQVDSVIEVRLPGGDWEFERAGAQGDRYSYEAVATLDQERAMAVADHLVDKFPDNIEEDVLSGEGS